MSNRKALVRGVRIFTFADNEHGADPHNSARRHTLRITVAQMEEREGRRERNIHVKMGHYYSAVEMLTRAMNGPATASERDIMRRHRDRLMAKVMNLNRRAQVEWALKIAG